MNITYISDDIELSKKFLSTLPTDRLNKRFTNINDWNPKYLELVLVNGNPVALVDCTYVSDEVGNSCSHIGFIASEKHGGFVINGLIKLKNRFPNNTWIATSSYPNQAIATICRRYIDKFYDQAQHDIHRKIYEYTHRDLGQIPLTTSLSTLKNYGYNKTKDISQETQKKIFININNSFQNKIITPNNKIMTQEDATSLAFDLLDLPYLNRQHFTRRLAYIFLFMITGDDLSKVINKEYGYNNVKADVFFKKIKTKIKYL